MHTLPQGLIKITLSLILCILISPRPSEAQANNNGAGHFDVGFKVGSLLPYGIEGVRELLPIWGVKVSHSMGKNLAFEYDLDIANAKGVTYYQPYFSLRTDFSIGGVLPVFGLIGVDGHYYKRADAYGEVSGRRFEFDYRFTAGWHLGFGSQAHLFQDFYLRSDVRMGFGPGQQVTISMGGLYRF